MLDHNLGIILVIALISNTIYGLAAPFLPKLLENKGIASSWNGVIFAVNSISMVVVTLIAGQIVDSIGLSRLMSYGSLLMAVSIACCSSAIYLKQYWTII